MEYRPFDAGRDLDGVVALYRGEGWPSRAGHARARRALTAPGVVAWVAEDAGAIVGCGHVLSDRTAVSYLATLVVRAGDRRRGIGRELVARACSPRAASRGWTSSPSRA